MLTDYSRLTASEVAQIVDVAISAANDRLAAVISEPTDRTYADTLAPLDQAINLVRDADGISGFMARIHPDEAIRKAGSEADETIQKWLANLAFSRELYLAVRDYSETHDAAKLEGEWARTLEMWLQDFRRAGQELDNDNRKRLQNLRSRLIELQVAYERNLDEWEDGIDVTRPELAGMSDAYVARLKPGSAEGTFRVAVTYPDYVPLMEQATNRYLRRQMQFKVMNRAAELNLPLLNEAVKVRWDMAQLLGYRSYLEFALEPRMADPESLAAFYESITPGLLELGRGELGVLETMLHADHPNEPLMPWDWTFYDARQAEQDFASTTTPLPNTSRSTPYSPGCSTSVLRCSASNLHQ